MSRGRYGTGRRTTKPQAPSAPTTPERTPTSVTPHHGIPTADPLTSRQSRTWDPAFDDPTYRTLVDELGPPGLLVGPGQTVPGEVVG